MSRPPVRFAASHKFLRKEALTDVRGRDQRLHFGRIKVVIC